MTSERLDELEQWASNEKPYGCEDVLDLIARVRELERFVRDAPFPPHRALFLTHNEHWTYYESVAEFAAETPTLRWVSDEQREKAGETGDFWSLQWYPDNRVGFNMLGAADLDVLLQHAREM